MRLRTLGTNQTLIHIDGNEYFFSYNTCVAGRDENGYWKVDKFYSRTTSKHINQYLDGVTPTLVSENDITLALDCV